MYKPCKSKTMINRCVNQLTTIYYCKPNIKISKRTCVIEGVGGKPTEKSVVYAAECTKHKLIYIGQTRDQLSN